MKIEGLLNWLDSEKKKDSKELENQKKIQIEEIKNFTKHDFFDIKPKKLSLWQRLKRTLMGF